MFGDFYFVDKVTTLQILIINIMSIPKSWDLEQNWKGLNWYFVVDHVYNFHIMYKSSIIIKLYCVYSIFLNLICRYKIYDFIFIVYDFKIKSIK